MDFRCILLPNRPIAVAEGHEEEEGVASVFSPTLQKEKGFEFANNADEKPELKLWGLTLGMTL